MISQRRICWPKPDATCLHGGCIYCNGHPYRSVSSIRAYAESAGVLPHRGIGEQEGLSAYLVGLEHDFYNADSK